MENPNHNGEYVDCTSDKPSVLLAMMHKSRIDPRFLTTYTTLLMRTASEIRLGIHQGFGAGIDKVRNNAVKNCLSGDYTHLFFLDDDTLPRPDAILRLLKHDLPIVSGLYCRRSEPHYPIIINMNRDNRKVLGFTYPYEMNPPKDKLVECDAVGAGCLLIKREVFEKMPQPWFKVGQYHGEDIYFCLQAKEAGYKILVDTGVECMHVVEHIVASRPELIDEFEKEYGYRIDYGAAG